MRFALGGKWDCLAAKGDFPWSLLVTAAAGCRSMKLSASEPNPQLVARRKSRRDGIVKWVGTCMVVLLTKQKAVGAEYSMA